MKRFKLSMSNASDTPSSVSDCQRLGWIEYTATRSYQGGQIVNGRFSVASGLGLNNSDLLVFDHDENDLITIDGLAWVWVEVLTASSGDFNGAVGFPAFKSIRGGRRT